MTETALRIGIDAHIVGAGKGGVERFLRELCIQLPRIAPQHRYSLFVNRRILGTALLPEHASVEYVPLPFANPLIERALVLPWLARRHHLDVLLVQRLAPWAMGRCRIALTVHDITPVKYPGQYTGLANRLVRLLTGDSVRRADQVLTPTKTVAREIAERYAVSPSRFTPYYNGVDTQVFSPREQPGRRAELLARHDILPPYLFSPGAMEPRKNYETLYRAMALIPKHCATQLVIAGGCRDADYASMLHALAEETGLRGRIRHLGFVPEADLVDLYRHAAAMVSASRDEGFDMPILEAMACGIPVVCSDIAVHRELFEGSVLFFPADSEQAVADCLMRLDRQPELRAQLIGSGLDLARHLTWQAAARRVLAGLEGKPLPGDDAKG